jgi:TPR repeat protein
MMSQEIFSLFDQANKAWDEGRFAEAFEMLFQAALQGDASAQNSLGYFYENGIGIEADAAKAESWYRRAARNGDPCACSNLGVNYRNAGNNRRAIFWFKKAVEQGDSDVAVTLAELYFEQKGNRGHERARTYLERALNSEALIPSVYEDAVALLAKLNMGTSLKPYNKELNGPGSNLF